MSDLCHRAVLFLEPPGHSKTSSDLKVWIASGNIRRNDSFAFILSNVSIYVFIMFL